MEEVIYEWWLKNRGLDSELRKFVQEQCFNKRIEGVRKLQWQEIEQLISSDWRFTKYVVFRFDWLFDIEYAVIPGDILDKILNVLRGRVNNAWTVVAVVESVTGLNCGFVVMGSRVKMRDRVIYSKEPFNAFGFLTEESGRVVMKMWKEDWSEFEHKREGEYEIIDLAGVTIFD